MSNDVEPVDITPEDSVVPIYLVPTTDEEWEERRQQAAELAAIQQSQEDAKQSALNKLAKIGLTEEEVKAVLGL